MTMPAPLVLPPDDRSSFWRWTLAAIVVVLVHAGIAYWLSRRVEAPNPAGEPEAVVMIELPPMAVAEPAPAAEVPPGPQMREAAPEPETPPPEPEKVEPQATPVPELPPEPKADAVLVAPAKPTPETPPPQVARERIQKLEREKIERRKIEREKIKEEKRKAEEKQERASRTSAPRQSAGATGQAAEAARGSAGSTVSASAWQGLVSARVNSNTRYPPSAQGATGAATVSFSVDRSGRLAGASLSRSSGSSALDAEAVATVRRSSPFPPPPSGLPGGRFNFSKTINFRH